MSSTDTLPEPQPAPRRRLGWLLLLGLIALPGLFCWFTLRRGYSNQLRAAAFTYAAVTALLGLSRYFTT